MSALGWHYFGLREIRFPAENTIFDAPKRHPRKHLAPFLLVFWLAAASGCTPRPAERTMETWLAEEPDSCLWYYTELYPSLVEARQYDSLERMYARLLRAMPAHPKTGPDTEYLTGWVLTYYYNTQVLQDKTGGGNFATV